MFKKVRLRTYLLTVFSGLIILAAIIMAIGIGGLVSTRKSLRKFTDELLVADLAVKTCLAEENAAARYVREMLLTDDAAAYNSYKENIRNSMDTVSRQLAIFKEAYGEADGLAIRYENAFKSWLGISEKILAEMDKGNKEGARQMVMKECTPALNELSLIAGDISSQLEASRQSTQLRTEKQINIFIVTSLGAFALLLVVSIYIEIKTTHNIVGSTNQLKAAVIELSKGNLKASVDYKASNEFGELADYMNDSFGELSKYVGAIDFGMGEFSKGNFTCECPLTFRGDFRNIQSSIESFQKKMNDSLVTLSAASSQIESGSSLISGGAQTLAQGSTEQASSVQELSMAVTKISSQLEESARFSESANSLGKRAGIVVQESQSEMKLMLKAIQDIASTSEGVKNIIKTIDDIAFQTNILALNAAVEAARAGSAGKGFAVVADEVRNLAQKSAEAAKGTAEMIENSLKHVERGEKLAGNTEVAFNKVANDAAQILGMVDKIALAINQQASSLTQISGAVEQISAVVQTNSATAEENAAASEELNGQVEVMNSVIAQYVLNR